jgi:formate hydrogenlyase subunit 3/multisubunit Na+/H+ antiporter MnhD subunit
MCAAMAILALLCIVLGLAAPLVVPAQGACPATQSYDLVAHAATGNRGSL